MDTTVLEIGETQTEKSMSLNHSRLAYRLGNLLSKYETKYDILPELDFELIGNKAKPDIAICNKMPVDWLHDVIRLNEPPVTVIEILSPKQAYNDLTDKMYDTYFRAGVQSVWIILPTVKTLQLFIQGQTVKHFNDTVFNDPVNGIEVDIKELFKS
jgi:Uma2 family endonuclease